MTDLQMREAWVKQSLVKAICKAMQRLQNVTKVNCKSPKRQKALSSQKAFGQAHQAGILGERANKSILV